MGSGSSWAYAVAKFRLLWLAGLSADQCITRHYSFRSLDSAMWQQEAREPRMVHRDTGLFLVYIAYLTTLSQLHDIQ
jgi:hypothetical protein